MCIVLYTDLSAYCVCGFLVVCFQHDCLMAVKGVSSMHVCVCVVSVVSLLMVCVGVLGSGLSLRSAAALPLGQRSSLIPTNRRSWPTTVACCKNTTTKATSGVHTYTWIYTHNVLCLHYILGMMASLYILLWSHYLMQCTEYWGKSASCYSMQWNVVYCVCICIVCLFVWSCIACV